MYNIFAVKKWISYYLDLSRTYPDEDTEDTDINRPKITDMNIMPCVDPPWFHPAILYDEDKEFVIEELLQLCNEIQFTQYEYNKFVRPVLTSLHFDLPKHSRIFAEGTYQLGFEAYDNDLYKVDDDHLINALRVKFSKHTCIQDKIRNTNILTLNERFARYIV